MYNQKTAEKQDAYENTLFCVRVMMEDRPCECGAPLRMTTETKRDFVIGGDPSVFRYVVECSKGRFLGHFCHVSEWSDEVDFFDDTPNCRIHDTKMIRANNGWTWCKKCDIEGKAILERGLVC